MAVLLPDAANIRQIQFDLVFSVLFGIWNCCTLTLSTVWQHELLYMYDIVFCLQHKLLYIDVVYCLQHGLLYIYDIDYCMAVRTAVQ